MLLSICSENVVKSFMNILTLSLQALIASNNIYYYSAIDRAPQQVTRNGNRSIFNGIPDWLYGEKILKSPKAIWWSPSGEKMAFTTFDDTEVDIISYPKYGTYKDPNNLYPTMVRLHYPRPGRRNPVVSTWLAELGSNGVKTPRALIPPFEIRSRYAIFT